MGNDLQNQINELKQRLEALTSEYFTNNFTESQDFNKYSRFNTRLKVPHYSSTPSTCEVGEVCEVGGKLYICSAADTWSVAGTQS